MTLKNRDRRLECQRKGRRKKETPDPGLTMGTDIEDHLKPDGKQVEIELSKVRIDQGRIKGQIRRKNAKLLQKRMESLEAAPPTGPIHVFLWEDNSMFRTDCSFFSLHEPPRMDLSSIRRWRLLVCMLTAQIRSKRRAGCLDLYKWHTTCTANILKPDTLWAFCAKLAGQAQGSAQNVEPIPL